VSFPDPHHPFTPPGRYWDLYSPADIAAPPTHRNADHSSPPHVRWLHAERAAGRAVLDSALPFAVTAREAREAIALTYGMIAMVDERIGRMIQMLEVTGLSRRTVIVFTSDHGDFMGDHGLMLKGPIHYQGLIRAPFVWMDPQRTSAAGRVDLSGTLDIARTLLHRAGVSPANGMQGRDLFGPASRGGAVASQTVLVEDDTQWAYLGFRQPLRARTLVTQRWRMSTYLDAEWGELYDLRGDPGEERNLWDDPTSRAVRADLMQMQTQKMMELCDRSPLPTARA
jgi:arylsulfatase A-like enzyme